MKPSRELDALVAKKVMGIKNADYDHDGTDVPKPYSSDIAAAWQVVEKLHTQNWSVHLDCSEYLGEDCGGCDIRVECKVGARGRFYADASTAPHAICLAALKAVEASQRAQSGPAHATKRRQP